MWPQDQRGEECDPRRGHSTPIQPIQADGGQCQDEVQMWAGLAPSDAGIWLLQIPGCGDRMAWDQDDHYQAVRGEA